MPKFKKKPDDLGPFKISSQLSPYLREISTLISRQKTAEALEILNDLVSKGVDDAVELSKILSLIGDAEFRSGRYRESLTIFKQAGGVLAANERIRIWIRSALGEIRCLLKLLEPEKALTRSNEIWEKAVASHTLLQDELAEAENNLGSGAIVRISQRPIRPSVVLTRLGSAFLEAGYVDVAKHFFQQAVLTTPNGATRARQGMAKVFLAENNPEQAERYAREALQMGKFQAKTVNTWELLIKARAKQDKTLLDQELFTSLNVNQEGKVLARSVLSIVKTLRAYGDPRWKDIALEWLRRDVVIDEIVEVEFAKIVLSDEKLIGGEDSLIALSAFRIFRSDRISPKEMVATAKDVVHMLLVRGEQADFLELAEKAKRQFGSSLRSQVVHSMALGAMRAKRHDLAQGLLEEQLDLLPRGSEQWGKGFTALARSQVIEGEYEEAAESYFEMAACSGYPVEFRITSLVNWANTAAIAETVMNVDEDSFGTMLEELLGELSSYQQLLLVARKLTHAKVNVGEFVLAIVDKARNEAVREFESSQTPEEANLVVVRLCRKLFFDFQLYEEVVSTWYGLQQAKQEWLWSQQSEFWEWLSLVAKSLLKIGEVDRGKELISSVLDSEPAVETARLRFILLRADLELLEGNFSASLPVFRDAILESPSNREVAIAHYWLGVRAYARGSFAESRKYFVGLRRCYAGSPNLLSEWELDARALLVLNDRSIDSVLSSEHKGFKRDFLEQQNADLDSHLEIFRR